MVLTIPYTTVYCPPMTLFIIVFMITWRHSTVNGRLMVKKSIVSNRHDAFCISQGCLTPRMVRLMRRRLRSTSNTLTRTIWRTCTTVSGSLT